MQLQSFTFKPDVEMSTFLTCEVKASEYIIENNALFRLQKYV